MKSSQLAAVWLVALAVTLSSIDAQEARGPRVPQVAAVKGYDFKSPVCANHGAAAAAVYETTIRFARAGMLQLELGAWNLPGGGWVELTSLADGDVERLDAAMLAERNGMTAYFNGDALRVRLFAGPSTTRSWIRIKTVAVGHPPASQPQTLCGVDSRQPSFDKRVARILIRTSSGVGVCTAWLISPVNCFASAGHCTGASGVQLVTAQFNVPFSTSSGGIVNPPASDQYAWETTAGSAAFENAGVGRDWAVFRTLKNSVTGQHAGRKQGGFFEIIGTPANQSNTRVTGNGTDATPPQRNFVQQSTSGPLIGSIATRLQYRVDTEGGNSGSPVIDVNSGKAFGVHTHGGCTSNPATSNSGTAASHSGFAAARKRICVKQGVYTTYGTGCPGSGGTGACIVLPKAYATKMGQSANTFPHTRAGMRYQQVFLGSEIGGAKTLAELSLRYDEQFGGPASSPKLLVKLGPTTKDHNTLTNSFAGNYSGTATTVFQGTLNLPARSGGGKIGDFDATMKFPRFYAYPGGNVIVEIVNQDTSSSPYFLDMASGASDVTTTRAYAFTPNASAATALLKQQGLVMCFRERGTDVPKLGNTGVPMIGASFQVTLSKARPSTPVLLSLGSRTAIPMPPALAPGCTLYSTLDVLGAFVTDGNGATQVTFPLPRLTDLICLKFSNQFLVLDIVNPLGVVFSNGGEAEIGG